MLRQKSTGGRRRRKAPKIVIYTSYGYVGCYLLKKYLRDNRIDFIEKNITINPQSIRGLGLKNRHFRVPLIRIGRRRIFGFNKAKLDRAILAA